MLFRSRASKEPCEIEELDKAAHVGYLMHTTAMKMCRPGVKEQLIAGALDGIASQYGSMVSFPTILTQHGETLHNHGHDHLLEKGHLMLTDAGAELTRLLLGSYAHRSGGRKIHR